MENQELSEFGIILLFIVAGAVFTVLAMGFSKLLRPAKPNPEKNKPYESGEEAIGNPWAQFNTRFYVIALIFLLFEVELVFLFPWATVFGRKELVEGTGGLWGWFALTEVFLFAAILAFGLAYAWAKGYLEWTKPKPQIEEFTSKVPPHLYEQINEKYK